eukprot:8016519-Pyramimonas_sp.AAC.1
MCIRDRSPPCVVDAARRGPRIAREGGPGGWERTSPGRREKRRPPGKSKARGQLAAQTMRVKLQGRATPGRPVLMKIRAWRGRVGTDVTSWPGREGPTRTVQRQGTANGRTN